MIVDDEIHVNAVVGAKLRGAGFSVLSARDGEEAMNLINQGTPDLVITDWQMPRMSGIELSRRLRTDPRTAGIPVIMVTSRGHRIPQSDLDGTNIVAMMAKPFSPRELLAKAQEILSRHAPSSVHDAEAA
ncbi:MAG: response regulator [Phycisphaerae bacterium]|nr:response regulator [Phycisphaerae bacterium]